MLTSIYSNRGCKYCKPHCQPPICVTDRLIQICYGTNNGIHVGRTIDAIVFKERTSIVIAYKEMLYFSNNLEYLNQYHTLKSSSHLIKLASSSITARSYTPKLFINREQMYLKRNKEKHRRRPLHADEIKQPIVYRNVLNLLPAIEAEFQNKITQRQMTTERNLSYESHTYNIFNSCVSQLSNVQLKHEVQIHLHRPVFELRQLKVYQAVTDPYGFLDEPEDPVRGEELDALVQRINGLNVRQRPLIIQTQTSRPLVLNINQIDKSKIMHYIQSKLNSPGQSERSPQLTSKLNSARLKTLSHKFFSSPETLFAKIGIKENKVRLQIEQLKCNSIKNAMLKTEPNNSSKRQERMDTLENETRLQKDSKSSERPKWQSEQKKLLNILNMEIDKRVKTGKPKCSGSIEKLIKEQKSKISSIKEKGDDSYGYWTTRQCKLPTSLTEKNIVKIMQQGTGTTMTNGSTYYQTTNNSARKPQLSKGSLKEMINSPRNLFQLNYKTRTPRLDHKPLLMRSLQSKH